MDGDDEIVVLCADRYLDNLVEFIICNLKTNRYKHCLQIAPLLLNEYYTTWEDASNNKSEKGKKDQPTHLLAGECFKACVEYPLFL